MALCHPMTNERHLTTKEAAERSGYAPRTIRHFVKTKRLAPVERIGNTMMFRAADIDALRTRNEVAA